MAADATPDPETGTESGTQPGVDGHSAHKIRSLFSQNAAELLELAEEAGFRLAKLTLAERELLRAAPVGDWADCRQFAMAARSIDPRLLQWLLLNTRALSCTHPTGIQIRGAEFRDDVDIQGVRYKGRVGFVECHFGGEVMLQGVRLGVLSFQGSKCKCGLQADGAVIEGDVFLRDGFVSRSEVRLLGARIGGGLDLHAAAIRNSNGVTLNADGAEIKGDVFLRNGFISVGELRLPGATVGGNVEFGDARLRNRGNIAVSLDGASIGGSIYIRRSTIEGATHLPSVCVAGTVQMSGSSFIASSEVCRAVIDLTLANVAGFVAFVDHWSGLSPAKISGTVRLRHARFGQLDDSPDVWGMGRGSIAEGQAAVSLDLEGLTYGGVGIHAKSCDISFRKAWLARGSGGSDRPFTPQPYNQLATMLYESGHEERAREIRIERNRRLFHEVERSEASTLWLAIVLWVKWLLVGQLLNYGFHTRRTVIALCGMWLFGAVLFWGGWVAGSFKPALPHIYNSWVEQIDQVTGEPVIAMDDPQRRRTYLQRYRGSYKDLASNKLTEYPGFMSLVYSADTLLPIVNLHQEPYWEPTGLTRAYLWLHILGGWLFTTLAVVGFTGIVRRD